MVSLLFPGPTPLEVSTLGASVEDPQPDLATKLTYASAAIEYTSNRDVIFDPALMQVDRPYNYDLEGTEYVAIKRADGRLDFYELPGR